MKDMERMRFGVSNQTKPNKSVQSVLFDGEVVGWLYSSYKNILSPIEEVFWSIYLKQEQADKFQEKNIEEAEDVGFYHAYLELNQQLKYADLYEMAEKVFNIIKNK